MRHPLIYVDTADVNNVTRTVSIEIGIELRRKVESSEIGVIILLSAVFKVGQFRITVNGVQWTSFQVRIGQVGKYHARFEYHVKVSTASVQK